MLSNNIQYISEENQQKVLEQSSWSFEVARFKGSQVFCPMCVEWHENNTMCQRSD